MVLTLLYKHSFSFYIMCELDSGAIYFHPMARSDDRVPSTHDAHRSVGFKFWYSWSSAVMVTVAVVIVTYNTYFYYNEVTVIRGRFSKLTYLKIIGILCRIADPTEVLFILGR